MENIIVAFKSRETIQNELLQLVHPCFQGAVKGECINDFLNALKNAPLISKEQAFKIYEDIVYPLDKQHIVEDLMCDPSLRAYPNRVEEIAEDRSRRTMHIFKHELKDKKFIALVSESDFKLGSTYTMLFALDCCKAFF